MVCRLQCVYVCGGRFSLLLLFFCPCRDAPPCSHTHLHTSHSLVAHVTVPGLLLKENKTSFPPLPHKTVPRLCVARCRRPVAGDSSAAKL